MSGYRALRIGELLSERVVDLPYMARAQMDLVCPPARQVVRLLGRIHCTNPTTKWPASAWRSGTRSWTRDGWNRPSTRRSWLGWQSIR